MLSLCSMNLMWQKCLQGVTQKKIRGYQMQKCMMILYWPGDIVNCESASIVNSCSPSSSTVPSVSNNLLVQPGRGIIAK